VSIDISLIRRFRALANASQLVGTFGTNPAENSQVRLLILPDQLRILPNHVLGSGCPASAQGLKPWPRCLMFGKSLSSFSRISDIADVSIASTPAESIFAALGLNIFDLNAIL